jgi:hypothetical protein
MTININMKLNIYMNTNMNTKMNMTSNVLLKQQQFLYYIYSKFFIWYIQMFELNRTFCSDIELFRQNQNL